jgi:methylmalonyl-CoA mutase cobalamin-binding subunit
MKRGEKILGASLGTCVHVAGIQRFLRMCEEEGYQTTFLGPAIAPQELVRAIEKHKPDTVAVSYRLTPEVAEKLFQELKRLLAERGLTGLRFVFGGTPPVAEVAKRAELFERVFSGLEPIEEVWAYIRGARTELKEEDFPQGLVSRIDWSYPHPLIRHHFGRPTLGETVEGARLIAEARVLDVISIGPDQNAQESFFRPQEMDPKQDGAGGVPLRKAQDLEAIYEASRCGNYPLVRCYSGTRDLLKWAEMSVRTIKNAWAAIPLCWYSVLDGRSDRGLAEAITENQQVIRWYAEKRIPVEVNESHQWSLRDAHDSLAVTMAYLAAYNAKKLDVRHYVAQYMFNTPPGTSPAMDLAKMLAKIELIESLEDESFTTFRQVRAGLASMPSDFAMAKGHLAASAVISQALQPHILHVVGYSEGHHAITAEELIESCQIAHGAVRNSLLGLPDLSKDPVVQERKAELLSEARVLLEAISNLGKAASGDPWTDPQTIASAIERGLLDTPHFAGHRYARGAVVTKLINGACYAVDPRSGRILTEAERLASEVT